jgi:hypothetical protein
MIIELAHSRIEYDSQSTRQAYAGRTTGSPEECGCLDCRNFIAARHHVYSEKALNLFTQLGINADREAEIYHNGQLASGLHSYGGWFHFAGKLLLGSANEFVSLSEHFQVAVTSRVQLVPATFKGLPLLQLEFLAEVPWVIGEPSTG